ncbi:AAA family ATPase [Frigidibacter sp. RF13]|uniref:AAA family ATPase n=1 Tax=Frigidibacter sp. RF13 TaxID=2997340 RepID=UPI002271DE77|nr:AAA family ATPase [Frigidibacter sp. RF13]MCY1125987.1 AAA family ATPase [Frigidibacter sp. RF13]
MTPEALADLIRTRAEAASGARFLAGLAGPPGSGKSTLAADLARHLGEMAKVVPMDGFHYDDRLLAMLGLSSRKGAPETFDAAGFLHLLARLRTEVRVAIPIFDRGMELSRAAADLVTEDHRILIVEGNYLLLDEAPWRDIRRRLDLTIMLDPPEEELLRRLRARWAHYGRSEAAAEDWIATNDLPNIRRVRDGSGPADIVLP